MTIAHETVVYDIEDFKVYALLSDSSSASPTFGAAIDVPGISEASLEPNLITAELYGDARIIDRRGRTDRFKVAATYSKIQFDVMATLMGGIVSDITSPNETRWDLYSPAPLPYFKCEFKIDDVDTGLGTLIVRLNKCQLTGGTLLGQSSNNFGKPHISFEAFQPAFSTTPMGTMRLLQNVTALSS